MLAATASRISPLHKSTVKYSSVLSSTQNDYMYIANEMPKFIDAPREGDVAVLVHLLGCSHRDVVGYPRQSESLTRATRRPTVS